MNGRDLLHPHWVPVYWLILWREGRWPDLIYHETDDIDGYSSFGWWQPI